MGWSGGTEVAERLWDLIKENIPSKNQKQVAQGIIDILTDQDWDCVSEAKELCRVAGYKNDQEMENTEEEYFSDRVVETRFLSFKSGNSDKVYKIELLHSKLNTESRQGDWFKIKVMYGRRNTALKEKIRFWTDDRVKAEKAFVKTVQEKIDKGYKQGGEPIEIKHKDLLQNIQDEVHDIVAEAGNDPVDALKFFVNNRLLELSKREQEELIPIVSQMINKYMVEYVFTEED